ncbi:hypothetical protein E3T32_09250 [Cryobacterium sp. TMT2-23]|nr:hypothetical protein E3T32_09250 [Cryobacterium sp. TMT2-23]
MGRSTHGSAEVGSGPEPTRARGKRREWEGPGRGGGRTGTGRDGPGRDGTGRDGPGRDGPGRDGTDREGDGPGKGRGD